MVEDKKDLLDYIRGCDKNQKGPGKDLMGMVKAKNKKSLLNWKLRKNWNQSQSSKTFRQSQSGFTPRANTKQEMQKTSPIL